MLRSETERLGALLIFDEVITGFRLALGGLRKDLAFSGLNHLRKITGGDYLLAPWQEERRSLKKPLPN